MLVSWTLGRGSHTCTKIADMAVPKLRCYWVCTGKSPVCYDVVKGFARTCRPATGFWHISVHTTMTVLEEGLKPPKRD